MILVGWKYEVPVIPVRKSDKLSAKVNTYRPIAIMPCLSKIIERIVDERLFAYLENNGIRCSMVLGEKEEPSTI